MNNQKQNSKGNEVKFQALHFLENYPALPYILKWTVIGLLIGVPIGTASAGFLHSLHWATNYRESNVWIIALLPVGGFGVALLYHYFGKTSERGNNLLIDTIHDPKHIVPFRMAPLVYFGTVVTHFFGGSAGREGTALQMAGAIADQFSKPLGLTADDRRILMVAAVAAGFGSVFDTPLAGAVFGLEFFLIGKIRYNSIFPAFITAIIADTVTRLWNAPHTHYHIDFIPDITFEKIGLAIIAGIFFGICAAVFSRSLHKLSAIFNSKISYPPLRPVIGGIIVVAAVWLLDTTKYIGLGLPTIVQSFEDQLPAYDFAIKIVLTVITLAAGYKGGEVTPLFFIGATLGNALSLFIPLPMGLLAGMGFVGVFAGATNTPIACSFMAIELFGAECGMYVAIGCVVSYIVSGNNSIYSRQALGQSKSKHQSAIEGKRLNEI